MLRSSLKCHWHVAMAGPLGRAGRKSSLQEAVQGVLGPLAHRDIMGHGQRGDSDKGKSGGSMEKRLFTVSFNILSLTHTFILDQKSLLQEKPASKITGVQTYCNL